MTRSITREGVPGVAALGFAWLLACAATKEAGRADGAAPAGPDPTPVVAAPEPIAAPPELAPTPEGGHAPASDVAPARDPSAADDRPDHCPPPPTEPIPIGQPLPDAWVACKTVADCVMVRGQGCCWPMAVNRKHAKHIEATLDAMACGVCEVKTCEKDEPFECHRGQCYISPTNRGR